MVAARLDAPFAGRSVAVLRGRDTLLLRGEGWADSVAGRRAQE